MKIILASASPRRAEILSSARIPFEAIRADVDESRLRGESASAMVQRLAWLKAQTVAAGLAGTLAGRGPAIVIGADTAVEIGDDVLGKPGSAECARQMLRKLSGKTHRVVTGFALIRLPDGERRCGCVATEVTFATMSEAEIERYASTPEPLDKAGAYAIQGLGGKFVERIEGCYFNVVGLPLARLYALLKELGWTEDPPSEDTLPRH